MAQNNKKSLKKTNYAQFQKLVDLMEKNPQLTTCNPAFGSSRATVEWMWDVAAESLNALGPPSRSGYEWKKVWQDQKFRLKKKLTDNNKGFHGTEEVHLTELELQIDRICHLSSSATREVQISEPFTTNNSNIEFEYSPPQTKNIQETTPIRRPFYQQRKRKRLENVSTHKQKLLYQQMEIQNKTLDIMNKQLEASLRSNEVAKIQAETAKTQAETAKEQAAALEEIANASKAMAQCLVDITKQLKGEDYEDKKLF